MESRRAPPNPITSRDQVSSPQTTGTAETHTSESSGEETGASSLITAQSASEDGQYLDDDSRNSSTASGSKEEPSTPDAASSVAATSNPSRNRGAGSHSALSYNLMGNMVRSSRRSDRLVTMNWQDHQGIKPNAVVWRKDMQTFVLKYLRQHVHDGLRMVSERLPKYLVPCDSWEVVGQSTTLGAILWFPPAIKAGDSRMDGENEDAEIADDWTELSKSFTTANVPPTYAMFTWRGQQIPVYNMPLLLGPSLSSETHQLLPANESTSGLVILQMKRRTTRLLMDFWKLMGYIAEGSSILTFDEGNRPHETRELQDEIAMSEGSDVKLSQDVEISKVDPKLQTRAAGYIGRTVPFVRSFVD